MRPRAYFEVEFESFCSEPTRSVFCSVSDAEVLTFASANLKPSSELFVACLGKGVDFRNLIVEVAANGRATVIVHEHRGFIADGLTLDVAVGALQYWLPMQEKIPSIQWADQ